MFSLTSTMIIEAPADEVWAVLSDGFGRIGEWATAIPASRPLDLPGHVTGAPVAGRVCATGIRWMPEVTETVVAFDPAARSLTYEATDGMPAFVTLARNRWQVTPLAPRRSEVTFAAELRVRGILGYAARLVLLLRVGRTGRFLLDDLKHVVERGGPSPRKHHHRPASATGL